MPCLCNCKRTKEKTAEANGKKRMVYFGGENIAPIKMGGFLRKLAIKVANDPLFTKNSLVFEMTSV